MLIKIWLIKSNLLGLIDIKAEDCCAAFGELQRERKTDVTETDDGYFRHGSKKKLKTESGKAYRRKVGKAKETSG